MLILLYDEIKCYDVDDEVLGTAWGLVFSMGISYIIQVHQE